MDSSNEKVFKVIASEGQPLAGFHLIVALDRKTGVEYVILQGTRGVAITPRLDKNGELYIAPIDDQQSSTN